MSPVVVLAIPNSELPPPSLKLLTYLNESSQSLCCLAVKLLGNRGDGQVLADLFFDRVLGDEGAAYSETVTHLHQQYQDYMNALDHVLFHYLGEHMSQCDLRVIKQTQAVLVVECHYDPIDPLESPDSDVRTRGATP